MKKTIKPIYALGICLLLLAGACKKNELPANTTLQNVAVQEQTSTNANRAASSKEPNAVVEISPSMLKALAQGQLVKVKSISAGVYRATGATITPVETAVPYDPCSWNNMWAAYNAFMAANLSTFQSWANANCQPFMGCWCSPCGLCVMYQINPTRLCPQIAIEHTSSNLRVRVFAQ